MPMRVIVTAAASGIGIAIARDGHHMAACDAGAAAALAQTAALCLFLASPASAMISRQAIAVGGHAETFHID